MTCGTTSKLEYLQMSLHTTTTSQSSAPHLNFGIEFLIVDVDGVVLVVLGPSSQ